MTRKSRKLNVDTPLAIYLLAGATSVVLAGLVVLLAARTVHADAGITAPQSVMAFGGFRDLSVSTTPLTNAPLTVPTPATLSPQNAAPAMNAGKEHRLHGLASWYGGIFDGRPTASGETYDMYSMTACHPTLPFGSLVRVINRINHRSVVVRINDRGDLVDNRRVIDLSYAAAEKLAMVRSGLAPVDIEVLSLGKQQ